MSLTAIRWIDQRSLPSQTRLAKRLGEVCIIVMICASFTLQPITTASAELWVKAEQLLLPFAAIVYLWMLLAGLARPIRVNGMFAIGALYFASLLISVWYGSHLLGQPIIFRDLYELPKVWLPVAFFTVAYEAELSETSLKRLLKFYGLSTLLVCLYAWAQWLGLGVSYYLNQFYSAGVHDDALLGARRVYATMGNPNLLGQLMNWILAAFLMALLYRVGDRIWNSVIALSCLVTLAMTGSRYGVLDGFVIFAVILILPSYSGYRRRSQGAALGILAVVFAIVFGGVAISNRATLERYQSLRDPAQVDSFQGRLATSWREAAGDIRQSPLFGWGPAKVHIAGTFTDSEYLDVLRRYGAVGFSIYSLYFFFPLYLLIRGFRALRFAGFFLGERMPATLLTLGLSTVMLVSALIMNFGMATFYSAMIQGLLWMWFGLGARAAKTVEDVANTIQTQTGRAPERSFRGFSAAKTLPIA